LIFVFAPFSFNFNQKTRYFNNSNGSKPIWDVQLVWLI